MDIREPDPPGSEPAQGRETPRVRSIMQTNIIRAGLDPTLGEAMTILLQHRIRHLPVVDNHGRLAGLVTDRDLRLHISHRLGTIMENNADREALRHHLHVIMVRRVVTAGPDMTVQEAAQKLLDNHIGCLPVVDADRRLVGIVSTGDFLRLLAETGPAD